MAPFTDLHRVLLQALMSRRAVPEEVALELYKRAYAAVKGRELSSAHPEKRLKEILQELSSGVRDFDLDIMRSAEQGDTGRHWICLVNTRSLDNANDLSAAVSDFTPLEISFYRQIVLQVVDSYPANSIGSKQALQIAAKLETAMQKSIAESLLQALVSRGWLDKSSRGRYSLGVRAILELDQWLRTTYGDPDATQGETVLNACSFNKRKMASCKDLVFVGWKCAQPECGAHIHHRCKAKLTSAKQPKCPACQTPFDIHQEDGLEMTPVGEDAVPVEDDNRVAESWRGKKRQSSARNGNADSEDSGVSANEEESEDEVATQGDNRGRASRRLAAQVDVEEVQDSQQDGSSGDFIAI